MKKSIEYLATWLAVYFVTAILATGTMLFVITTSFESYYEGYINGNFIGYYETPEQYTKFYNELEKIRYEGDLKIERSITTEPTFERKLVKKDYANSFNNYTLISEQFSEEYVICSISINNENKFYIETKEKAEKIVSDIKKEINKSTKIKIEEIRTTDKSIVNSTSQVSKTKAEVIKKYTVVSRGGYTRTTKGKYIWPTTSNIITSYFGARWGSTHTGVDIGVKMNSPVFAMMAGTVTFAGWNGDYGYQVKIKHSNGVITTYAHNSKVCVSKGQKVNQGDIIARSGSTGWSTGPHLHVEFIVNGSFKNPLNYL